MHLCQSSLDKCQQKYNLTFLLKMSAGTSARPNYCITISSSPTIKYIDHQKTHSLSAPTHLFTHPPTHSPTHSPRRPGRDKDQWRRVAAQGPRITLPRHALNGLTHPRLRTRVHEREVVGDNIVALVITLSWVDPLRGYNGPHSEVSCARRPTKSGNHTLSRVVPRPRPSGIGSHKSLCIASIHKRQRAIFLRGSPDIKIRDDDLIAHRKCGREVFR